MRVYYDRDADVNLIKGKKVAVVGYGSQGHAHAMNLRDSGATDVVVALREGSASAAKAEGAGFKVMNAADAAAWADVVMVLVPDELQGDLYRDHLHDNMKENAALAFAHGLNVHFSLIEPRADLDIFMIAPKDRATPCVPSTNAAPACPACWRCIRIPAAIATTSASATRLPLAAAGPGSSRPPSRKSVKPTSSANRPCFAVACRR